MTPSQTPQAIKQRAYREAQRAWKARMYQRGFNPNWIEKEWLDSTNSDIHVLPTPSIHKEKGNETRPTIT